MSVHWAGTAVLRRRPEFARVVPVEDRDVSGAAPIFAWVKVLLTAS